jgi:hypothetical protein
MPLLHRLLTIVFLAFVSLAAGHCTRPEAEKMLFDFELESELDHFHWQCHTLFSLSDEHMTHGGKSLKLELFPSDYPGLAPMLAVNDWRAYGAFSFDVYNSQKEEVPLTVRIDDAKDSPDYADRYNKTFNLKPGINSIIIPVKTLTTSGTDRKLNLKNIYEVVIFMARPKEKVVLYFDYFRLKR